MCLKLGIDDWEQWLEDVPERVFEAWRAHYAVQPWGDEQLLLARCVRLLSSLVVMKTGNEEHQLSTQDGMPLEWIFRKEEKEQTVDDQLAMVSQAFGGS